MLIYAIRKYLFGPLNELAELTHKVSAGELSNKATYQNKNELGNISEALNKLIDGLQNATSFVKEIGQGNLEEEFEGVDENTTREGSLEASLLNMRTEMKVMDAAERERKWTTEGLAKFVDILRSTDSDVQALTNTIISNLIDYTKSNQGAIYLINNDDEDDQFLEQVALYAFDTQKFEEKRIKLGEGLVGQTYLEKKTTYLLEVPHDYATIVSGLGGANPKAILLVPLMVNDEIYGVVELASFNEYQQHEIEFVEKLAESISSTISGVKNNELTRHLLEESQELTEQMQAQEEEMRQNMEELTATQEEMNRKARETEVLLEESQKRAKYIDLLVQIAKQDFDNQNALLSYSLEVIGDLLNWPVAHVYLTKMEDGHSILSPCKIWRGEESNEFNIFKKASEATSFKSGIGLPGRVLNQRTSSWINDIVQDPNFPRAKHAAALDLHSAFGTPLISDGEVSGVIEFFTKEAVDFDELLMDFMNQVGELIGSMMKRLNQIHITEDYSELQDVEEELRVNLEALEITQNELNSTIEGNKEKLHLIEETIGLTSCDEQGNIVEMNARACLFFNLKKEQVTQKNIKELINNYDSKFLVTEGAKRVEIDGVDGKAQSLDLRVQISENADNNKQIVHLMWL
ncbi:MAG: GAF domain-containing protein [Bacteroidota bacterium]